VILAVDVNYRAGEAVIAGVEFEHWTDSEIQASYFSTVASVNDYTPGLFYRRELPCILKLLSEHHLAPSTILIDGYVYLDGSSRPGLGRYLYDALEQKAMIIGVAKKPFQGIAAVHQVYRGNSARPLYVTCAGMELSIAKQCIVSMHGKHRIPTMLKEADRLSRKPLEPQDH
jgi:deoxyribonuclease V